MARESAAPAASNGVASTGHTPAIGVASTRLEVVPVSDKFGIGRLDGSLRVRDPSIRCRPSGTMRGVLFFPRRGAEGPGPFHLFSGAGPPRLALARAAG